MPFTDALALAREFANTEIVHIGDRSFTVATLAAVTLILFLTWKAAALVQMAMLRALRHTRIAEDGTGAVVAKLVRYAVLLVGVSVGLETIGIDLGALFTAGAVFAVGIGFAMQNIAQNFVSGIILLVERSIKPGDVLEVDGRVVRVVEMGIRATLARTRDDEDLIIPNATLVQSTVKNFTLRDSRYRLRGTVGVAYESDLKAVHQALMTAATALPWRLEQPPPVVIITEFASSSVNFEVGVWIDDPWAARSFTSRLLMAMWDALEAEGITISFPRVDVHLDAAVVDRIGPAPAG